MSVAPTDLATAEHPADLATAEHAIDIRVGVSMTPAFKHIYHVDETATPFAARLLDADGVARTDIASCVFRLASLEDPTVVLIDWVVCQSVTSAVCSYTPDAGDMDIAVTLGAPLAVIAQFKATTSGGATLPTQYIRGVIEANLDATGGSLSSTTNRRIVEFTDADLVAGVLTIEHDLDQAVVSVQIWQEDGAQVGVAHVHVDDDTATVDLAAYQDDAGGAIIGTWHYRVF